MLPPLTAEQQLARIEASSLPHMDNTSRRDVVRNLARQIGANQRAKPATRDDLAAIGIRVKESSV